MNKASAFDYASWYYPETIWNSFKEFQGYADVSVSMKPVVVLWKKTELLPEHLFKKKNFLNHLHHKGNVF